MNVQTLASTITQQKDTIVFLQNDEETIQEENKIEDKPETKKKNKKKEHKRIEWKEDTIDNENLGRLKSNLCCIYHKPKDADNPSSDTCTSDDEGNELDRDRTTKKRHKKQCTKSEGCTEHNHNHHNHHSNHQTPPSNP